MLSRVARANRPEVLVGMNTMDDAGVFRLSRDLALVQTVDFFTPVVDDPYDYGRIAAANSFSDVYAMGGVPLCALNIICFPEGQLDQDFLVRILNGAASVARKAEVAVIGGHSVRDKELKFGMAVTGKVHPDRIVESSSVRAGDALVLTKPLGTGILSTVLKAGKLPPEAAREITEVMAELNRTASDEMLRWEPSACTDITGFGLLGHVSQMIEGRELDIEIDASRLPLLPGLETYSDLNLVTGGEKNNQQYVKDRVSVPQGVPPWIERALYDPQTSGGLLVALAEKRAASFIERLAGRGIPDARTIGRAVPGSGRIRVRL